MNNLKIKVCGMRDPDNIRLVAGLKPDLMGFVFYPPSPRYAGNMPAIPLLPGILKTGVFVNEDLYTIKATILKYGLQVVQLHGNESPETCARLYATGIKVIKVFAVSEDTDFSKMMKYVPSCNWFLFDTSSRIPGGSGKSFDWKLLDRYHLGHPFFLSGGVKLADAEKILAIHNPALAGVDINSKFEIEPGVKDVAKVERFVLRIREGK